MKPLHVTLTADRHDADMRRFAIRMHRHEVNQARKYRAIMRWDRHAMALARARGWRLTAQRRAYPAGA